MWSERIEKHLPCVCKSHQERGSASDGMGHGAEWPFSHGSTNLVPRVQTSAVHKSPPNRRHGRSNPRHRRLPCPAFTCLCSSHRLQRCQPRGQIVVGSRQFLHSLNQREQKLAGGHRGDRGWFCRQGQDQCRTRPEAHLIPAQKRQLRVRRFSWHHRACPM